MRLAKPNTLNLDGIFAKLNNVVWTNYGPFAVDDFALRKLDVLKFTKPACMTVVPSDRCTIYDKATVAAGEPLETVKGAELSGKDNILFIRNSVSGRIEARYRKTGIELNEKLHKN